MEPRQAIMGTKDRETSPKNKLILIIKTNPPTSMVIKKKNLSKPVFTNIRTPSMSSIPREIKSQVVKKVEKKRTLLKKLYSEPKETINLKKNQQWGTIQMVKAFLGIPIIPGK